MTVEEAIEQLTRTGETIRTLVDGIGDDRARWRPSEGRWSIVEVICHLVDEEREDFRMRLDLTLHRPGEPWPKLDPVGIVTERSYNTRSLAASVASFTLEREGSLAWLASLAEPPLDNAYLHPAIGTITAGDLLASWVVHDLLHIRQLARLQYELVNVATRYSTAYAGDLV